MVHAVCHWLSDNWSCISIVLRSLMGIEFSSKNYVLSLSILSCGMGFSILGGFAAGCGGGSGYKCVRWYMEGYW